MKRFILSLGVFGIFVAYSYMLRHQHSEPVIAPASVSQTSAKTQPTNTSNSAPNISTAAKFKNGTYTGSSDNAFYGNVQVSATIQNGLITAVDFLMYPNENPNSQYINSQAMPYLKQEAIQAQSSNVNIISGATLTSSAFMQSLADALNQAKI